MWAESEVPTVNAQDNDAGAMVCEGWHSKSNVVRALPDDVRAEVDRRLLSGNAVCDNTQRVYETMRLSTYGVTLHSLLRYAAYLRSSHNRSMDYGIANNGILRRLPGEVRAALDAALTSPGRRSCLSIHREFDLGQYGVTREALRNYGRRLAWQHRHARARTAASADAQGRMGDASRSPAPPEGADDSAPQDPDRRSPLSLEGADAADELLTAKLTEALRAADHLSPHQIDRLSAALSRLRQSALRLAEAEAKRRASEPGPPLTEEELCTAVRRVYGLEPLAGHDKPLPPQTEAELQRFEQQTKALEQTADG